jgi:hypothetical protein
MQYGTHGQLSKAHGALLLIVLLLANALGDAFLLSPTIVAATRYIGIEGKSTFFFPHFFVMIVKALILMFLVSEEFVDQTPCYLQHAMHGCYTKATPARTYHDMPGDFLLFLIDFDSA